MVRNKRVAPAAPPSASAPLPLFVQTLPWGPDRRKARAPVPTTESATMPASVEKAAGVLPPPTGQTTARFCLGPYERRGGGTARDAVDGGSLGVDSEGSSTDVGVCLDDSASDVSQESLVTSDSAVSSPPARRPGHLSPGAGPTGRTATTPAETRKSADTTDVTGSQPLNAEGKKLQDVSINIAPSPTETKTTQVIEVNSDPVKENILQSNTVQVVSTSPEPPKEAVLKSSTVKMVSTSPAMPKAISVVKLNSDEVSSSESTTFVTDQASSQAIVVKANGTKTASHSATSSEADISAHECQAVSMSPPEASPIKQSFPSPTVSRASTQGASTVFLSPEQPVESNSSTANNSPSPPQESPLLASPASLPVPPASLPVPPASVTSQGDSKSSVFLSPCQSHFEQSSSQPAAEAALPEGTQDDPPLSESPAPQSPQASSALQTPRKAKAPEPPRKSPAPQPPPNPPAHQLTSELRKTSPTPPSSSPTPPTSPVESPVHVSPRQSPTPASLRQLPAPAPAPPPPPPAVQTRTYAERQRRARTTPLPPLPEHGFQFHLKESTPEEAQGVTVDGFAGVRDYLAPTAPIHSSRGTVRGVKDRVRAGIATFLQDNSTAKALKSREQGRLVVYVTSMSIVRRTFQQCQRVRQILRQLLAGFEERDLFLSEDHQKELQSRLGADRVVPPQVFIDGNLLGGAEAVERLNETGELRRMLRPFKVVGGPRSSCAKCGGARVLPCTSCNGSKKSCHRNHFTEQWIVLRCGTCDQSGLMRCDLCRS